MINIMRNYIVSLVFIKADKIDGLYKIMWSWHYNSQCQKKV